MRTRLVKIGNSRGIRLPKTMIEDAGLTEEVDVQVENSAVIITSPKRIREGWSAACKLLHERKQDRLLDDPAATGFETRDWQWPKQ